MIRILVDSSSDFTQQELNDLNIELVPLTVTLNEKNYLDGVDLDRNDFYEMLIGSEAFPKTSQPTPQAFLDIFEDVKAKNDEMICVLLSTTLSGTYQSAMLAKDMVEYDNIHIIDSLSATCMNKVTVNEACKLRDQNASVEEIIAKIKDLNARVKIVAMVDTLEYLYKGGRLSKAAASVGELVKIKPILTLLEDHTLGVLSKCLGKVKAMNYLLKHLEKVELDEAFPVLPVYTYGLDNCQKFEQKLKDAGYSVATAPMQLGATVGAHIGPGAFGVVYVVKK